MRRGDEINIAAAIFLKFEYRLRQLLDCHLMPVTMMADIKVLTKCAAQITACEKYRAGPAPADKLSLLAEVRPNRADHRHIGDAAKAYFSFASVNLAPAWTERAGIHTFPQLLNALAK